MMQTLENASALPAGALRPPSATPWWTEWRAMLALAWPLVLTNLAQTAMTSTAVMMLGWLGADVMAAATLGANLYFMVVLFGMGLVAAVAAMAAKEIGRMSHSVRDVRRTVHQGLWAVVTICIPAWVFLWNAEAILLLMGQQAELAANAGIYVRTLQWSLMPFLLYLVLRNFYSALERPRPAMWIGLSAIAFNAFANWLLIFGNWGFPALGIAGSGIATSLASTYLFVGLVIVGLLDRKIRRYRVLGRFWRADWPRYRQFFRIGLPIGLAVMFEATMFQAAAFLMGLIGTNALAGHAIALQFCALSFMVPLGVSQAGTVRVGRAFGANDPAGVSLAGRTALVMGVGFMALVAIAMLTLPHLMIAAFIDTADPANAPVVAAAVTFLAIAALFQMADGAQVVAQGALRGLHDTRVPTMFALLGYWGIGLPTGVALAFWVGWRGPGLWSGLAIGTGIVAILLLWRWRRRHELRLI